MSFCILVGIYCHIMPACHNMPACTPQIGHHGVAKVAKTADIAQMAENCIN